MPTREGYLTIALVAVFAMVASFAASFLNHWTAYLVYAGMLILTGLTIFFFRDPDRNVPDDDSLILAPADGKVVLVKETEEMKYIRGKATQISIFLSPLDVHVNRVPAGGRLEYVEYHPGGYLMAWDHRASELNERADFGIRHRTGIKIFFRQIAGFMARRIVYHISEGDQLKAGQRFGMMKFGSRMDILVPSQIEVNVRQGDRTVAGETVLGMIKGDQADIAGIQQSS